MATQPETASILQLDDALLSSVLQYLPVEDKIRLEHVSRRWQLCLFNRQTLVEVRCGGDDRHSIWRGLTVPVKDKHRLLEETELLVIDTTAFICVVRKCFSLKSLVISDVFCDRTVLDAIGRFCQQLEQLDLRIDAVTTEDLLDFCDKFGHKLRWFCSPGYCRKKKMVNKLLVLCRNMNNILLNRAKCSKSSQLRFRIRKSVYLGPSDVSCIRHDDVARHNSDCLKYVYLDVHHFEKSIL